MVIDWTCWNIGVIHWYIKSIVCGILETCEHACAYLICTAKWLAVSVAIPRTNSLTVEGAAICIDSAYTTFRNFWRRCKKDNVKNVKNVTCGDTYDDHKNDCRHPGFIHNYCFLLLSTPNNCVSAPFSAPILRLWSRITNFFAPHCSQKKWVFATPPRHFVCWRNMPAASTS